MGTTPETAHHLPSSNKANGLPRKRHWWRWVLASIVVIVVLVVGAIGSFVNQPGPSRLSLPSAAANRPVGPLDGRWDVATGSVVGFRVQASAIGFSNDTVGRTSTVIGTLAVSGNQITSAKFDVDLTTVKVGEKAPPAVATTLDTKNHPTASITLTQPVALSPTFTEGATITSTSIGQLTLHGVSHPVTLTTRQRRDGTTLQVAGSIPAAFSDWGIKGPQGYGFLGSIANHGVAEFLLVLNRA